MTIVTLYSALEVTLRYLLHYKLTILYYITDLFARHATIGNDITLLGVEKKSGFSAAIWMKFGAVAQNTAVDSV